ncbi:hypothetical protein AAMO2058_000239100 [Amorphochlora amoebiformis]
MAGQVEIMLEAPQEKSDLLAAKRLIYDFLDDSFKHHPDHNHGKQCKTAHIFQGKNMAIIVPEDSNLSQEVVPKRSFVDEKNTVAKDSLKTTLLISFKYHQKKVGEIEKVSTNLPGIVSIKVVDFKRGCVEPKISQKYPKNIPKISKNIPKYPKNLGAPNS